MLVLGDAFLSLQPFSLSVIVIRICDGTWRFWLDCSENHRSWLLTEPVIDVRVRMMSARQMVVNVTL